MSALMDCLLRRGFLMETTAEGACRLSDNAHPEDREDLCTLLDDCGLAEFHALSVPKGMPVANLPELTAPARQKILAAWNASSGEEQYPRRLEKWSYFRKRQYGVKVPVRRLEPTIAFLVKAFNAVEVITWCSCGGQDSSPGRIDFLGPYASAWARFLVLEWLGADPELFVFDDVVMEICPTPGAAVMDVAVTAAQKIYASRLTLRALCADCKEPWGPRRAPKPEEFYAYCNTKLAQLKASGGYTALG
jgi:hypothetical protein